jgi:uncharacterized protein YerC
MPESSATTTRQTRHDIGTRLQALCILQMKVAVKEIKEITGISAQSISRIHKTAIERGYNPEKSQKLVLAYVEDMPRSSRPLKATKEVKNKVVETILKNSTTR